MSQQSKLRHSREQWKRKATERAEDNRYLRKELARIRHERDRLHHAHRETQERLRQHEAQAPGLVVPHKVDMVWLALRLFLEVRISFRAVSRVLQLLAEGGALTQSPVSANGHQLGHATRHRPRRCHAPASGPALCARPLSVMVSSG